MTRDEMRQKWLNALRSGEYKQGRGNLRVGDEYCCLGVACEVLKDELNLSVGESDGVTLYGSNQATAPSQLEDALGLYGPCGEHRDLQSGGPALTDLNDDEMWSFNQIADEIETGNYWRD